MYTGLELSIIIYIVVFVIHIGLFRFFKGFYNYVKNGIGISPTAWCFVWPIAWAINSAEYIVKSPKLIYYTIEYVITRQWNYNK